MAGVTDAPFRRLCREHGAGMATTEMISSDTRLWRSKKTRSRLSALDREQAPVCIQIAGSEPKAMAEAAKQAMDFGADIIDINMGCPAKKVCRKLAGSALLRNTPLVEHILHSVVKAVAIPVTLKTRTGWDKEHKNGVAIAKIAEQAGIQALTVHGRTRACRFDGVAEYDTIAEIVSALSIPVVANGDINTPQKAVQVLRYTGAAAVMIGRPALGNPWIFEQVERYISTGELPKNPSLDIRREILLRHLRQLTDFYGEQVGVRIARKHVRWYLETYPNITPFLKHFNQLHTSQSQQEAVTDFLRRPETHEEKVA